MPFVDASKIPEVLMRKGIHERFLAHRDLGATGLSLLMNRAAPGAAVPLHFHQVEETVVMFAGRVWVRLGDERHVLGPDDTVIIPPHIPHAWGTEGDEEARMMWVLVVQKRWLKVSGGSGHRHLGIFDANRRHWHLRATVRHLGRAASQRVTRQGRYTPIAAMSGLTPTMFVTRVRL
jgi:quercetin dioxygenase-like cupin family protein